MRWVLRLVEAGNDARSRSADLMEICRPEGLREIADLGLSLPEAKQLLTSPQRAVDSPISVCCLPSYRDGHRLAIALSLDT